MVSTISQGDEDERQAHGGPPSSAREGQRAQSGQCDSPGGDEAATERRDGTDKKQKGLTAMFERFAAAITARAGSPAAFCLALSLVVIWALSGPLFGFSEKWQLVINSGTTIVTFLMVFLIQQSQNKDSQAVHLKLDELLKLQSNGGNEMIDIEDLTEEQIKHLSAQFKRKGVSD